MEKPRKNKTLAEKLLDSHQIWFQVYLYNSQERDAVKVASLLNIPAAQLYKSLGVLRERGKPLLVIIPADRRLDLKRLAAAVGEKKLKMAAHQDAEKITRLKVGGISPLALLNRGFDMVLDQSSAQWETIFISAGQKGINLELAVVDLVNLINPQLVEAAADDDD